MDYPKFIISTQKEESIIIQRVEIFIRGLSWKCKYNLISPLCTYLYTPFWKQCKSKSAGFIRSQLNRIYNVFHLHDEFISIMKFCYLIGCENFIPLLKTVFSLEASWSGSTLFFLYMMNSVVVYSLLLSLCVGFCAGSMFVLFVCLMWIFTSQSTFFQLCSSTLPLSHCAPRVYVFDVVLVSFLV